MCHNRYIEYTLMYIDYVEYNEYIDVYRLRMYKLRMCRLRI